MNEKFYVEWQRNDSVIKNKECFNSMQAATRLARKLYKKKIEEDIESIEIWIESRCRIAAEEIFYEE